MSKTLHQKLTSKTAFLQTADNPLQGADGILANIRFERNVLQSLTAELMQPRPQAVNAILEMARMIPNGKER